MVTLKENILLQRLDAVAERYEALSRKLSDPKVFGDHTEYQRYAKEQSDLKELVERYRVYQDIERKIADSAQMAADPELDKELRALATAEVEALNSRKEDLEQTIRILLIPKDPRDDKNTFLEIRAGTGGDEAGLFAADLLRMYTKYAEARKWRVERLTSSTTGIGAVKEVVLLIEGKGTYSRLKFESGVHRVQRVPATEASGRIHTSTVTVAVLPEAEEVDIQIDQKDLRIDTFCSSGPGGQSVNTTYSAVRITHLPTNLVVNCQDERSQLKNKGKAMRILRARLLEIEKEKQEAEITQNRRAQVGTGERSEKIRTYNFPQNRITDHRIGLSVHKLDQVLEGDLDELIDGVSAWDQAEKLKRLS